ncbi:membrane protein insertase YidC [Oscillatoria laete-virens NRMC-F 0139]|nr:membrane protein insertase YidC [Oscillatoria laete-virens NRMC-F 0139]
MDKKSIIVVSLCVVLLIFWGPITHMLFPPKPQPVSKLGPTASESSPNDPNTTIESLPKDADSHSPATPSQAWATDKKAAIVPPVTPAQAGPPKISVIENAQIRMELINLGAGVQRFVLKEHLDRHLNNDTTDNVTITCQYEDKSGIQIPGFALIGLGDLAPNAAFETTDASDQVVYETTTASGIKVRKTFHLSRENDYNPILLIEIENGSDRPLNLKDAYLSIGTMGPLTPSESKHYTGFDLFQSPKVIRKHYDNVKKEPFEFTGALEWAAIKNQFFTLIVDPYALPASGFYAESVSSEKTPTTFAALLGLGNLTIPPGQATSLEYKIYAGPKEFKRLRDLGDSKDQVMAFEVFIGFSLKFFGYITQMLLSVLIYIDGYTHNFGLAIVIITIFIKLLFWPLTGYATKSMKKMAALQPRLIAVRDKYKDNPQKLQQEMMRMYREYKVNPFSGCLPALLQLPIFLAFYSMLQSAIELRGATFLWIKDLSQPDTILHLFGVSWLPVNPMPLLMAGTMFVQMHMTPSSGDPMQKRIFMLMPVIFLIFCYNFSSGLSLYWTVQNLLTILQTWLSMRKPDPELEKIKSGK